MGTLKSIHRMVGHYDVMWETQREQRILCSMENLTRGFVGVF